MHGRVNRLDYMQCRIIIIRAAGKITWLKIQLWYAYKINKTAQQIPCLIVFLQALNSLAFFNVMILKKLFIESKVISKCTSSL